MTMTNINPSVCLTWDTLYFFSTLPVNNVLCTGIDERSYGTFAATSPVPAPAHPGWQMFWPQPA